MEAHFCTGAEESCGTHLNCLLVPQSYLNKRCTLPMNVSSLSLSIPSSLRTRKTTHQAVRSL